MDAMSRLDQERIFLVQIKPVEVRDTAPLTERERLLQEKHRLERERWDPKRQFTDTYPDFIAVTEQLNNTNARLATTPESNINSTYSYNSNTQNRLALIDKELQRHKQQQEAFQQQIKSYQGRIESVPALETQLSELTRNYEVSKQNYQSLLDKTLSAGMSEELERKQQAERFTILDLAKSPEKPIRPKRLPMMAAAVVLALLISAGIVIGTHLLIGSIKSETELKEMLPFKIQVLGTIPQITSEVAIRRGRIITIQTFAMAVIACIALVVFLLKARPII